MRRITLERDDTNDDPPGDGLWKIYSFSPRHSNFKHPDDLAMPDDPENASALQKEIADKLKKGLAFYLSYYEHGSCVWSLRGLGPNDRYTAGILVYDEDVSAECVNTETLRDRIKTAVADLETYTCWANGEVYGYRIEDVTSCKECGHEIVKADPDSSCWGFYGNDIAYMASEVREALGDTCETVEIVGDASWLADKYDFGQHVVVNSKRPDNASDNVFTGDILNESAPPPRLDKAAALTASSSRQTWMNPRPDKKVR